MTFQTTLSGMLSSMLSLRLRQFRWTLAYWARAFGLLPKSGKWAERITFVYIYVLIIALMTPAAASLLNGLYVIESKTAPALQASTLFTTLPALIGFLSVLLVALPWKAWMLRLTYGDMTYLAPSPFDRRVLAVWRYVEVVFAIILIMLIPFTLLAPVFGSILAVDVIPAILRGALALGFLAAPMLALGWHLSLQEYTSQPPPVGIRWIARLSVIVAAGVLLVTRPEVLLWPGRLIVLLAKGEATWGWPLLIVYGVVGVGVVWITGRHLSMTRASAGSDVFARIQQLGFMVLMDRQLLVSIIGEARANESYAVGMLPHATGVLTLLARAALYYRRQFGQAIQLMLAGAVLGLGLVFWRPANLAIVIITIVLLVVQMPPWLSKVFRRDLGVPFISQFIPQPLTRRLLASSVVPCVLVLTGMLPVMIGLNAWLPPTAWGMVPAIWVLSLVGHVEVVGKRNMLSDRNLLTVLMGCLALFVVVWGAVNSGIGGVFGLFPGIAISMSVSFALLTIADMRYNGLAAAPAKANGATAR